MRQETWKPNPSYPLNNSCTSIGFKHYRSILDTIPEPNTALVKAQETNKRQLVYFAAHGILPGAAVCSVVFGIHKLQRDCNALVNPIFWKKKSLLISLHSSAFITQCWEIVGFSFRRPRLTYHLSLLIMFIRHLLESKTQ